MLAQRLLVSILLLPIGAAIVYFGGPVYGLFIGLILGLAALEFAQLFQAGNYGPPRYLTVAGAVLLAAARYFWGTDADAWAVSLVILAVMAVHLAAYERGVDQAGTDFAITLAGALYVGWLGSYLLLLRELPGGTWWVMLTLAAVWLADSGAFFVGSRFGRRRLTPRLSPKKTWEGYFAGLISGTAGAALLASIWQIGAPPEAMLSPARGALLGGVLSLLAPLGDLGISMIKRQVGVKDSGRLLPGHGGILDRLDSWLWAAVLGYYLITWFFQ